MISGTNFLTKAGLKLDYSSGQMSGLLYDCIIPVFPCVGHMPKDFDDVKNMYHNPFKDELLGQDWFEI